MNSSNLNKIDNLAKDNLSLDSVNIPLKSVNNTIKSVRESISDMNNASLDEDEKKSEIILRAESLCKKGIVMPLDYTYSLLNEFKNLEKKPQYKLNSKRKFNKESGLMETFFTLDSLEDFNGDYSKFNLSDVEKFDNFIKFEFDKKTGNYTVVFGYINIRRDQLPLLKRQLYYDFYIKLIEKGVKSGFKDFDSIFDEYIAGFSHYNNIKYQDKFTAIVAGPDLFFSDVLDEKTGETKESGNLLDLDIGAWFNTEFTTALLSFFENDKNISELKRYNNSIDFYDKIIKNYKERYSYINKNKIQKAKNNKVKFSNIIEQIDEGSQKVQPLLEKAPNIREFLLLEIEKCDDEIFAVDEIDNYLHNFGIKEFRKKILGTHRDFIKILEDKKRVIPKDGNLEKALSDIQKLVYKETAHIKKIDSYSEDYDLFKIGEYKNFYKKIEKGDVIFNIELKNRIKLYNTDGSEKKNVIFKMMSIFNFPKIKQDFDVNISSNSLKITAKKSGILIDSFKNNQLSLSVDTDFFDNYKISKLDGDEYKKEPFEKENFELISYENSEYEHRNAHIEKMRDKVNLDTDQKLLDLAKSNMGNLEYSDYEYPEFLLSKNCNIDHLKGFGIFSKNAVIMSVDAYPEGVNKNDNIIKPRIMGEKIYIKYLNNSKQKIYLISDDYLNLSLLEYHKKLNGQNFVLEKKEMKKEEFMFDYTPKIDSFLEPKEFLKNIDKKIENFSKDIEGYDNETKKITNSFSKFKGLIDSNKNYSRIYDQMDKMLIDEINTIGSNGKLVHNEDSIKNFLNEKLFVFLEKNKSIFGKNLAERVKEMFLDIANFYFISNKNKKNVKIRNFYQKSLDNINNLNTSQEITIDYNSGSGVYINVDGHDIKKLNVEGNWSKFENSIYIPIPKSIGVSIKIKNGNVECNIKKTLENLIKEKMKFLPDTFFTSFVGKKYNKLTIDDKKMVDNFLAAAKVEFIDLILNQVESEKDIQSIEKIGSPAKAKNVFGNSHYFKVLSEKFEEKEKIGSFYKRFGF